MKIQELMDILEARFKEIKQTAADFESSDVGHQATGFAMAMGLTKHHLRGHKDKVITDHIEGMEFARAQLELHNALSNWRELYDKRRDVFGKTANQRLHALIDNVVKEDT